MGRDATMNPKQREFADNYLICGNATEAAEKAGYSKRSARTTGARLLANADTKAYIAHKLEVMESERIADMDETLAFLTAVMRGQVKDQFGLDPALSDRLVAARELLKRFNRIDAGTASLEKLDELLYQFRMAVSNPGFDAGEGENING
jgi:phage terminase small subunit